MSLSFLPVSQPSKELGDEVLEVLQIVSNNRIILGQHESCDCLHELVPEIEKAQSILKRLWVKIMTEDLEGLILSNIMKMTHVKIDEPEPESDHESEENMEDSEVVKTEELAA